MDIAFLAVLILLNGLFAMSEMALATARHSRLRHKAVAGDSSAAVALKLGENPTRFLSTIQIGITAIGILSGMKSEAALSGPLSAWLQAFGLAPQTSTIAATAAVVLIITYFSIVVGELVPKRVAQFNPEAIAQFVSRPISLLATISTPFVFLLTSSTNAVLRIIGKSENGSTKITEEDIYAVLAEGSYSGVIAQQEHKMARNVFLLDDRHIVSLMTPRSEIAFLDVNKPMETNMDTLENTEHSRFPVCRGGLDNVIGFITATTLLRQRLRGEQRELADYMLPAVFVPESMSAMKLLEQFRESGVQMVFVVDEYGDMLGLITLQDVLVALTGEFKPGDPEEEWAVLREDGSWLLDGLIPIFEIKERLQWKTAPEEERGLFNTLSGMIMWGIARVPKTGDSMEWNGWRLEVVDVDGKRVDKVLATRLRDDDLISPDQPE